MSLSSPRGLAPNIAEQRQKQRFAARCRQFFAKAPSETASVQLRDSHASGATVGAALHLSLNEMFIRRDGKDWRSSDFILIVSTLHPATLSSSQGAMSQPTALTSFVGPDALRRSALPAASGTVITDVPIAVIPADLPAPQELSLQLLRVARNRRSQMVLETIDAMITGVDHAHDLLGSMAWADAIMDRLEVLAHSRDGERVFGATAVLDSSAGTTRHVAFLGPRGIRASEVPTRELSEKLEYYVRNGRLLEGSQPETAAPARHQEFALLRLGRRIDKGPPITIRQLLDRASGRRMIEDDAPDGYYLARVARARKLRRLTSTYGKAGVERWPTVTPIAVRLARDLVPLAQRDDGSNNLSRTFQEALTSMKDGLRYELGLEIPGVRMRGSDGELADGAYVILLDEIPVASGKVAADEVLVHDTPQRLAQLGLTARAGTNPANGRNCAWLPVTDEAALEAAGVATWSAVTVMLMHLAAVLRTNAATFIGVKPVADLVRGRSTELLAAIQASKRGLPGLASVLIMLAEEEVPVSAAERICSEYLRPENDAVPLYEIAEQIRMLDGVREHLHYRAREVSVYRLAPQVVETIRAGVQSCSESVVLCLLPETTQAVLTAVREAVNSLEPADRAVCLMVDDWRLRRPLRKLVELEFPYLRVLAARELAALPDVVLHEVATLTLDETRSTRRPR